ncbi:MAG: hypothetical protein Q7S48_02235 [bacterium]|nr:hypothetical protein [bacterium]
MKISQLQNFFDEFHTIVGFETQAVREEMFQKLEDAIVGRSVIMILSGLSAEEKQKYDAFVRTSPTTAQLRVFLESSLSPNTFETHFKKEAERVVFDYTKTMLQMVNDEQKGKLLEVFGKLLKGVEPGIIASLLTKTELST